LNRKRKIGKQIGFITNAMAVFFKLVEQQEFSRVFSFLANVLTCQKILKNINFLSPHCNFENLNPDSTIGTGRKKMAS
jgi:hypothetical protein